MWNKKQDYYWTKLTHFAMLLIGHWNVRLQHSILKQPLQYEAQLMNVILILARACGVWAVECWQ